MNVYGDMGNVITLTYRLESRGYIIEYRGLDSLQQLSEQSVDILVGGGGQDSNQGLVVEDLGKYATELRAQCEDGLVCLMICGMYQLFGKRFITAENTEISGAGILDLETKASDERLIGNIVVESDWGKLVGFENHSGRTYLGSGVSPLGMVTKGAGNNGITGEEGVISNNVFCTYMHGPVLAKNPQLADELIERVLDRTFGETGSLAPLDDYLETQASLAAIKRPR